jgi:hypothetical protein
VSGTPVESSRSAVASSAAPGREVVERHLSRLDADALTPFVADLWAARGFETEVETGTAAGVVVATRAGESVVVLPYRPSRLGRGSPPDRAVDVVVAPGGGRRARRVADERGARLVDAAALRGMLLYAVDRTDADRLCERHLGAPLADLRPSVRTRVRARLAAVESPVPASAAAVALVALALAVVGVGAAATGGLGFGVDAGLGGVGTAATDGGGDGDGDGGSGGDAAADRGTPVSVGTGSVIADATATESAGTTNRPVAGVDGVPGVTGEGVVDLAALAAAHERSVSARSYTIWVDTYRPATDDADAPRVQEDVDVAVEGGRYRVVTSLERDGARSVVRRVYGEGRTQYVADLAGRNGSTTYRQVGPSRAAPSVGPTPELFASTVVRRYLSTPETTVTGRTTFEGRPAYRLAGRGRPSGLGFEGLLNYSVVAFVTSDGLVYDLTARYTVARDSRRSEVRFEWTYDRLDATTVERPAWVDREFGADRDPVGNATATTATATATPDAS